MVGSEILRVPLDTDAEGVFRSFDPLDDTVLGPGADAEPSGIGDCLVVSAVHAGCPRSDAFCESRAPVDADRVSIARIRELVGSCVRDVGFEVVVQGPAVGEGQQLHAVADAEDRQVAFQRGGEKRGVGGELRFRHRLESHRRRIRAGRREVVATGDQQAVESGDPCVGVGAGHVGCENRAGLGQRGGVGGSRVRVGAAGLRAAALIEAGRDPDERRHSVQYNLPRIRRREGCVRTLIAGCGYVGIALGERLAADGHEVWGLRSRPAPLPDGVRPIVADLGVPSDLARLPGVIDFVVYLVSPRGGDDALYRAAYVDGLTNLLTALEAADERPRHVLMASSTAVYGQNRGEWVDESSPTEPAHFSGRRLLEGEARLAASSFRSTALRFGGIYGPRRTGLVERVRTGAARFRPGHYTNRIHRDDCVGAIVHLLALENAQDRYVGVDTEPATEEAVQHWLAEALGVPASRAAEPGDASAHRGSKRCRNTRLLDSGYQFRHPTFREGYRAVLAEVR